VRIGLLLFRNLKDPLPPKEGIKEMAYFVVVAPLEVLLPL
jgi:hypothetical protein